jgi:hypothetical protein
MRIRHKIGFGIYFFVDVMAILEGLRYFLSPKMMPYHAQAIGKNWAELDRGIQIIILALMGVCGAGAITIGLIVLILLFIPFRRGERWVNWTIFLGGIVYSVLCFIVTFKVYLATNASTPWPGWLISMVLYLLGFLLSLGIEKEEK